MQCYGPEASAYTARRLFGQLVRLEDDVERHDIYGRRFAYVYLRGENFEEELLRKGYAAPVLDRTQPRGRPRLARRGVERACASHRPLGCLQSLIRASEPSMPGTGVGVRHGWS